jgi:hypothetical protein
VPRAIAQDPGSGRVSDAVVPRPSGNLAAPTASASASAVGWWIVIAHTVAAAALGAIDAGRLGSAKLALAVVPLFAAMGLITGSLVVGLERLVRSWRWWIAALVLTAPALIVLFPVSRSLFQGAYAQTLPFAQVAPYVLPLVLWVVAAGAVAAGRRILRGGDLMNRSTVILALAGAMGSIVWTERHVLGSGYPNAHIGATLALIVLAGVTVRITRKGGMPYLVAAIVTGLTIGGAIIACLGGLKVAADRQLLATYGDQSRDLVSLWRRMLDFDRDGSSALLGGGDCDDRDGARHPGALDKPGDGIDQDCDGADAVPPKVNVAPIEPKQLEDLASWRASQPIAALLDKTHGMHVLVVSVDALRADLLAPDAPDRADFPNLTKLLGESVWFTRAFAPASGTDVSLATFLTGRLDPFQPVATTLPEAFQAAGRHTFAALPSEVLRYAGEVLLGRGVDKVATVYNDWDHADVGDHVTAAASTDEAIKAVGELGDRPGFVWVHYFDVHEHHQIDVPKLLREQVHPGATKKITDYRALLRAIDNHVGRLLAELDKRNLADNTIVVFVSDHGESLGEDPRLLDTHGKVTYAPLVRVPIAFKVPGVTPGQRTDQVSLVDLAPTLLSLAGITPPDMQLDGIDLVPFLFDAPAALRKLERPLAINEELQWSVVDWPYQLIVVPADNLVELYDIEKDPAQKTNLAADKPDVVSRLKAHYATVPHVVVDRTPNGRSERERLARQRPNRAP